MCVSLKIGVDTFFLHFISPDRSFFIQTETILLWKKNLIKNLPLNFAHMLVMIFFFYYSLNWLNKFLPFFFILLN